MRLMKYRVLTLLVILLMLSGAIQRSAAMENQPSTESLPDLSTLSVLDLQTAVVIAQAQNPTMAAAFARVRQAMAQVRQARAAYMPRLDATASYARVETSDRTYESNLATARLFDPTVTAMENPDDYYSAGLRATWIVFNGFERTYMNRAARLGKEQNAFLEDDTRRLILSAVTETFLTAQLAAENMTISRADRAFNERLLHEARARSEQGAGSLSDEMNFEIRANSARARLLRETTTFRSTLVALATVMGVPGATFPEDMTLASLEPASASLSDASTDDTDTLIDSALVNRPDIRAARAALEASEAAVKKARSGFYPDVSVYAAYDGERAGDGSFESEDFGNSVGVNITYNLFSGGADAAKRREAIEEQQEAREIFRKTELDVVADVRRAVENLKLAQEELDIQESIATLVERNRDLVEKEYGAGQTSLVRLNEAQRDLTTARGQLALALVSLHQARFDLKTATGEILDQF